MYCCQDCGKIFRKYKVITEKHNLTAMPYEEINVCPFCFSTNITKKQVNYCKCCGARMYKEGDYCNNTCRRRGEMLWEKERRKKQAWLEHPLYAALKEVEQYNKEHGTNLSYGQYFAQKKV